MKNLVVAIYYHPEAYPPTLNAITELSDCFNNIEIIYRPNLLGSWIYPSNVTHIASGNFILSRDQENAPLHKKILFFKKFATDLLKSCKRKKPSCILLYDSLALLAYYLIRPLIGFKHKIWYHNHDVTDIEFIRKYSLGWYGYKIERFFLKKIDVFTLPTDDRLPYFSMNTFKGKYFCVPNYPSIKLYSQFYKQKRIEDEVRIIFQGRVGEGHGIEEIIPLLRENFYEYKIKLVLKGFCDNNYRLHLKKIATLYGVEKLIEFYRFSPYIEVPKVASSCHIGIGIFAKKDIMNQTLGTASNKLYEYAACGLPVLYLINSGVKKSLEKFDWAKPVDLSSDSIRDTIQEIIKQYDWFSRAAHSSFVEDVNFEKHFAPVKSYIKSITQTV